VNRPGPLSERTIVLAPNGRDGQIAAQVLHEAGHSADVCSDLPSLVAELEKGAGLALIADEAVQTADLRSLAAFLERQPSWSDLPIVLLTQRGGGPERNPAAARLGEVLGNVTFIERPFHPTTLASVVRTAVRSRRRQYEARSRLEELSEGEELLTTALRAGALGSWTLSVPAMELDASESSRGHFGRGPRTEFGYLDLLAAVHPDDRARMQAALEASLGTGQDYLIEFRNCWPDESVHWVELRARVLRDVAGQVSRLVGVSSDITPRKTLELEREQLLAELAQERTALSELTQTLEERVKSRTDELLTEVAARERAQEQLRQAQKMESIGQLTGGVAHDFNNLLMAVMGNLELLRKRTPDDPFIQRLIDGALQGARRGASLTQRLLAFARQQDLTPVSTDMGALLRGMSDLIDRSLGPQVDIELDIPKDLPCARVDPNQVELAILNLAINARDAMPDGGRIDIALSAETLAGDADLAAGDYLRVDVRDSGLGMDEATLERAIEPFFSTKAVGKGTGLGLSMVHGLVVQLGGALHLESRPGEGTVATLWLPVAESRPVEAEAPPPPPPLPASQRTAIILLVDDDPLIAMSTADMLEDLGHTVIQRNSGAGALDVLRGDGRIDLMMTDYAMPGMTGIDLASAAGTVRPQLPILLATGYADLPEGERIDLPRLAKPYQQAQLRAEIDRLLGAQLSRQA
jgi:signal transduction histidine kinase